MYSRINVTLPFHSSIKIVNILNNSTTKSSFYFIFVTQIFHIFLQHFLYHHQSCSTLKTVSIFFLSSFEYSIIRHSFKKHNRRNTIVSYWCECMTSIKYNWYLTFVRCQSVSSTQTFFYLLPGSKLTQWRISTALLEKLNWEWCK